jgi:hypothetical protein
MSENSEAIEWDCGREPERPQQIGQTEPERQPVPAIPAPIADMPRHQGIPAAPANTTCAKTGSLLKVQRASISSLFTLGAVRMQFDPSIQAQRPETEISHPSFWVVQKPIRRQTGRVNRRDPAEITPTRQNTWHLLCALSRAEPLLRRMPLA